MENPRKLSLRKEIEQEAEQIEKEIEKHPELEKIKVTEELDAALLSKICEYEKEKTAENQGNVRKNKAENASVYCSGNSPCMNSGCGDDRCRDDRCRQQVLLERVL